MPQGERAAQLRESFSAQARFDQAELAEKLRDIAPGNVGLAR